MHIYIYRSHLRWIDKKNFILKVAKWKVSMNVKKLYLIL